MATDVPRYPRRRDDNEREIIEALAVAGARVQQLDGTGVPDLLVGYRGHTFLIEVKNPKSGEGGGRRAALTPDQVKWWAKWEGEPIHIVNTCEEALAVLARYDRPLARPLSDWHDDDGAALWWCFPIVEPPYCGSPLWTDWPGYHTHWTKLVPPEAP